MATRRLEMRDGVSLMINVLGDESAELTVLLLHGAGQTRHSWRGTASLLAATGYRIVSADLRGHGDSDWARSGDYSLDALSSDVGSILAAFPGQTVVAGASVGGISALAALGEQGAASVSGLVLVDIVARIDPRGADEVIDFMRANPDGFPTVEAAGDAVAAYLPHRPRPASLDGLSRNLRRGQDGRYRWHWDPRFLDDRVSEAERRTHRLEVAARSLAMPVLMIRGAASRIVTEAGVRDMLDVIPHAQFVDIAGADHMVVGDSNDAFNIPLLEFIRSLDTQSSAKRACAGGKDVR